MPMVTRKLRDPDTNPCLSVGGLLIFLSVKLEEQVSSNLESDASTKCLDENNYDREKCSTYFLKYKNCRKFWNSIMVQRRQNGVTPTMPTVAERDEILEAMGKMPY